jgi:hypothetical protein
LKRIVGEIDTNGALVGAVDPVAAQVDAYNDHDIDRFAQQYSDDVVVEGTKGEIVARGSQDLRLKYGALFRTFPRARCNVVRRMVAGPYVICEELITGMRPDPTRAAVISRVHEDRIVWVRLLG